MKWLNQCKTWLRALAKRRVVIIFALLEVLVYVVCMLFYIWYPAVLEAIPIPMTFKHRSITVMSLCIIGVFVGIFFGFIGACNRKISNTRYYLFMRPTSMFFLLLLLAPIMLTRCACKPKNPHWIHINSEQYEYAQCQIVATFGSGNIVTEVPAPHTPEYRFAPIDVTPWPRELPGRRLEDEVSEEPAPVAGASASRRLQIPDVQEVKHRELIQIATELVNTQCTCTGLLDKNDGYARRSCFSDYDPRSQNFDSWCHIRRPSIPYCFQTYNATVSKDQTGLPWSRDYCRNRGCDCSRQGIPPSPTEKKDNIDWALLGGDKGDTTKFGGSCQRWRRSDPHPWCYVGFDSTCASKTLQVANTLPVGGTFKYPYPTAEKATEAERLTELNRISQWASPMPCQKIPVSEAQLRCKMLVYSLETLLICMAALNMPILVILFAFLKNRCGDPLAPRSQYAVESSSDEGESSDDWVVTDELPHVDPKTPAGAGTSSGRKSKRQNKTGTEADRSSFSSEAQPARSGRKNRETRGSNDQNDVGRQVQFAEEGLERPLGAHRSKATTAASSALGGRGR